MLLRVTQDERTDGRWAFVCHASSCRYNGAEATATALATAMQDAARSVPQPAADATGQTAGARLAGVARTGCLGVCSNGPAVVTYPACDLHLEVAPSDASEFIAQLAQGKPLRRKAIRLPDWYRTHMQQRLTAFVAVLTRR